MSTMTTTATTFVVRNQLGQYLTRKGEWVSGKDTAELYHQRHYDQALNQLIEMNAKDIDLRGRVCEVGLSEKLRPVLEELGPDPQQPELLPEANSGAPAAQQNNQTRGQPGTENQASSDDGKKADSGKEVAA
ncbi:MAG: hypothetical protein WBA20_07415 [Ketobacter sp.]|nr:MAG: hypothetical protein D6160_06685 [Ketobacter sp.]